MVRPCYGPSGMPFSRTGPDARKRGRAEVAPARPGSAGVVAGQAPAMIMGIDHRMNVSPVSGRRS